MSENQRQHPRKEIRFEVRLGYMKDPLRTVITRDISHGGIFMFLDNPDHYNLGEMLTLEYLDPLENGAQTHKDAVIVRHTDEGIGAAFIDMEDF